jgi:chaperonin GroES
MSKLNLKPLYDRVIVRRDDEEETTAGGIVLPGSAKEKSNQGEVLAVGDGAVGDDGKRRPMTVKVGDKIVFGKYSDSDTVQVGDDEYIIMREDDVRAIIS